MADQWLHMYHQNTTTNQLRPFHFSDHHTNSGLISDSTVVTSTTTTTPPPPPPSSGANNLTPDSGRVVKPVRKRSRASRRTPTTLLNTDAANFRAMVQQFTGGPSNTTPNFAAFAGNNINNNSHALFNPPQASAAAAAAYHEAALFQFQNQNQPPPPQPPPFMFSLGNSTTANEAFFQQAHGGNNYMGLFDGSSPTAQNSRPA